jgi:hypothetical protein
MTMIYREINSQQPMTPLGSEDVATVRIVGHVSIKLFKEMVQRANNCWDTAPVEMKEFSDMVTHGKLMQNYSEMPVHAFTKKATGQ